MRPAAGIETLKKGGYQASSAGVRNTRFLFLLSSNRVIHSLRSFRSPAEIIQFIYQLCMIKKNAIFVSRHVWACPARLEGDTWTDKTTIDTSRFAGLSTINIQLWVVESARSARADCWLSIVIIRTLLIASHGCLDSVLRRRTWPAAISLGELLGKRYQPGISEWGNPSPVMGRNPAPPDCLNLCYFFDTQVRKVRWGWKVTLRTETSHVAEEKKLIKIPLVVASEKGKAQTQPHFLWLL